MPFAAQGVAASPAVEFVLRRALAKAPAERFGGVASLAIAFASAGRHSSRARSRITLQRPALEAAVDETRNLAPSTQPPLDRAWFALRAALAFEDPVLLAAARRSGGPSRARVGCAVSRDRNSSSRVQIFLLNEELFRSSSRLPNRWPTALKRSPPFWPRPILSIARCFRTKRGRRFRSGLRSASRS